MKRILVALIISIVVYGSSFAYEPTSKDKQLVVKIENIVEKLYSNDKYKEKRTKLVLQIKAILKKDTEGKIKLSGKNKYILDTFLDIVTKKLEKQLEKIKEKIDEAGIINIYQSKNWTISVQGVNENKNNEYIEIGRNDNNYNIDYYIINTDGEKTIQLSEKGNYVIANEKTYNIYINCLSYIKSSTFCVNVSIPNINKDNTLFKGNITGAVLGDYSLYERTKTPIEWRFNILSRTENLIIDSNNGLEKNIIEDKIEKNKTEISSDYSSIISTKCTNDWPDNYSMRKYCEDKQYDGIKKLNLGKPNDIKETKFNIIRNKCTNDWLTDFSMRAYCEDKQYKGVRELNLGKPSDIKESEFNTVRNKCTNDWLDDFSMRVYCENKQYNGIRELK